MGSFPFSTADLAAIAPELIITVAASIVLLLGAFDGARKKPTQFAWITLAALVVAFVAVMRQTPTEETFFSGLIGRDGFGMFFSAIFLITAALAVAASIRFLEDAEAHYPEYYFFLLTALLGMMVMARSVDFVSLFVGLELQSLSIYVLVGYLKGDKRSNEGGMKYFILGALSSAIFLYAISLFYALTGTTNLAGIAQGIAAGALETNPLTIAALILMASALGFKVAAVPFHVWAPDAYSGGPTTVSLFITVASKAAAFAVMLRIFVVAMQPLQDSWALLLAVLATATMFFGNIAAITQTNIKRLLAYSSIAHAGNVLIGVVAAATTDGDARAFAISAALFYLLAYTFMNVGAWGTVVLLRRHGVAGENLEDYSGLVQRSPGAFVAMLIFLLSLGGIPPMAGFLGKWYVFAAAINSGWTWLAVVGAINAAISIYYYLRVVVVMSVHEPVDDTSLVRSAPLTLTLVAAVIMTVLVGVYASPFLSWAASASQLLP
ncbi:MAG: NADH-quinone oxidoreductase subunit N [Acidobacteriota bacterium]|jgi:NADH-quinone oxidoreductase subunit N